MPILADIIFAVRIHCKTAFGGWRRSVGKIKKPNDHFWTVLGALATRATLQCPFSLMINIVCVDFHFILYDKAD